MVRHYFPGIDIEALDDEEFAIFTNDAEWLHHQKALIDQSNALAAMGGAFSSK